MWLDVLRRERNEADKGSPADRIKIARTMQTVNKYAASNPNV